jgi:hypothetical protein
MVCLARIRVSKTRSLLAAYLMFVAGRIRSGPRCANVRTEVLSKTDFNGVGGLRTYVRFTHSAFS